MSQAFIREGDEQNLSDVAPTLNALLYFLTRENNGIRVYEKSRYTNEAGVEVFAMSNGMAYSRTERGVWQVAESLQG